MAIWSERGRGGRLCVHGHGHRNRGPRPSGHARYGYCSSVSVSFLLWSAGAGLDWGAAAAAVEQPNRRRRQRQRQQRPASIHLGSWTLFGDIYPSNCAAPPPDIETFLTWCGSDGEARTSARTVPQRLLWRQGFSSDYWGWVSVEHFRTFRHVFHCIVAEDG